MLANAFVNGQCLYTVVSQLKQVASSHQCINCEDFKVCEKYIGQQSIPVQDN